MGNPVFMVMVILIAFVILFVLCLIYELINKSKETDMSHEAILKAFKDIFPDKEVWSYKKLDSHSIEITCPQYYLIFIYYGPASWQLQTK